MKQLIIYLLLLFPIIGTSQEKKPKLVVGIVVDQMRYDYLIRFKERFGEDGFKRLLKGINCVDAQYNYVPTYTGPGHASLYTGFSPSGNGIVGNDWYSRKQGKMIDCVEDKQVKTVGSDSDNGLCSPIHLQKQTIMEIVKESENGKSISVSFKNRGAILPAGTNSDGVYWYDYSNGNFITSTFYEEELPSWVQTFNDKKIVASYEDSIWKTLYPIASYTESREDDNTYEVPLNSGNPVFPYSMKKMLEEQNRSIFRLFSYTPWANSFLIDFGIEAIENEELGKDDLMDFINISISCTDIAGHKFGPYSVEIEDIYLRLDRDIANLLHQLDEKVGEGEYVVFLTADHGVVPNPDYLKKQGKQGGFIEIPLLLNKLEHSYLTKYKASGFITKIENNNIYFNLKGLKARKIGMNNILFDTKWFLSKYEGIELVFERDSLIQNEAKNYKEKMVKNGINERSGELIFLTKEGYLPIHQKQIEYKGTSHGSAWDYDTHIPLLIYGNGIPTSIRKERVEITDLVPTLLNYLQIQTGTNWQGTKFNLK